MARHLHRCRNLVRGLQAGSAEEFLRAIINLAVQYRQRT